MTVIIVIAIVTVLVMVVVAAFVRAEVLVLGEGHVDVCMASAVGSVEEALSSAKPFGQAELGTELRSAVAPRQRLLW